MKIKTVLLLSTSILFLSGCVDNGKNAGHGQSGSNERTLEYFVDNADFSIGDLNVKIHDFKTYKLTQDATNWELWFDLDIVNTSPQKRSVVFSNDKIVRDSNNAEYSIGGLWRSESMLESEIVDKNHLNSKLPTSIDSESYTLWVQINSTKVKVHLYESTKTFSD